VAVLLLLVRGAWAGTEKSLKVSFSISKSDVSYDFYEVRKKFTGSVTEQRSQ
jgi:hypothetical protein